MYIPEVLPQNVFSMLECPDTPPTRGLVIIDELLGPNLIDVDLLTHVTDEN